MKYELAQFSGFCFGVKAAVEKTVQALKSGEHFIIGDLVHNNFINEDMKKNGLKKIEKISDIEEGKIIIRAHGELKSNLDYLKAKNIDIIDTTCIKVKKIYDLVENYSDLGYNIIIAGDKKHPEIKGIVSRINSNFYVIDNEKDALNIKNLKNLLIISQTTFIYDKFKRICDIILDNNENVIIEDTICNATKNRQLCAIQLAKKSDIMIVLGSESSSNCSKLYQVCKEVNPKTFFVDSINDIDKSLLKSQYYIGITAGASVPDSIIKEAVEVMENLNRDETLKKGEVSDKSQEEMMQAIEDSFKRISRGEVIEGTVIYVTDNDVSVNINFRSDGIIKKEDMAEEDVNPKDIYKQGDKIKVYVVKIDDGEGNVVLSTKKLKELEVWDKIESLKDEKTVVTVKVKSVTKGGLIVNYQGIQGFIPASLASVRYKENLDEFLGKTLDVIVIDIDKQRRRLVFSRKDVEKEELEKKREEAWSNIEEGKIVKGVVRRLTDYGAFVDIGGVDGLIHITDMAWGRIKNPKEVLKEGQEVEVKILSFNKEKNRISLGLKQTTEEPWVVFTREHKVGDIVEGKIVNVESFGAFVRLMDGIDALLHVSQISKDRVNDPNEFLKVGDTVTVKIIDIREDRKVSVSIRKIDEDIEENNDNMDNNEEEDIEENNEIQETEEPIEAVEEKDENPSNNNEVEDEALSDDMGSLFPQNKEN